ncbi:MULTISPECIES: Ig-like domain-containing protein [Niastella]|uniref:T9SS type A sorting domain-containing protein n=1 Tax=Niastella soli TaxID=2821487 RepID=A0ABS3Z0Q6_9BACT|nr:Ig-like domain-containing protein [Niastella soli]MBO9203751.1 T9SS type A sorting domain-containing protein [Niastella soli]
MQKLNLYLLAGLIAFGSATYAQDKRFPIGSSNNVLNSFRKQITATQKPNRLSRLTLQLSPSLSLPAAVNFRRSQNAGSEQLAGTIENMPNSSFYLMFEGKSVNGHILLHNTKKAYKYYSDNNGAVFVEEEDINKVVCINYQQVNIEKPDASTTDPATANAAAAVTDLQSFPGGNGCVLLDFDGQLVSGTGWNNGNPINAAPANLTDADKEKVWQLISEDYRPFHINITTSEAVFNTYPKTKRMRCIFTPTNTAAPGAGGVAYLGSFKWNDETPCWVFNSGARAAGEAGSHEVGHTLGLAHDGRTTPDEEYYQGQGNWAPIMGVGYYVSLVQWSKGEYANASQTQDDLAIITSSTYGIGYRTDDYGNTITAAAPLTVNTAGAVSNAGLIERTGDVDMFAFNTTGGNLSLTFTSNAAYPDLDILATLHDANGTAITTSNPTGLNASISSTLAAGKYFVSVTGTGSGSPATTGYSNYGSLGTYTITGTVAGGSTPTGIAIFYKDCNYTGTYAIGLNEGSYTKAQLLAKGISDKDLSSIKITTGYEVVLYKSDNFGGASAGYTADVSCLVSSGWNDSTTSLRIRSISNTLPVVSITSPTNGSTFTAPASITINANATDADGLIAKVEFFNGTTKLGEDVTAPYSYTWSIGTAGTYAIKAVATDDRGGQSSAQITVGVNNPPGVTVYKHCDFGGYAINLPIGSYTLSQLMALGAVNDDISSLKVNSGYEAILYQDNNFAGPAYLFKSNATCLVSVGLSGGSTVNLNDWASSVVIRQTGAMTTQAANAGNTVVPYTEYTPSVQILPNPASNEMVIRYGNMGDRFDVTIMNMNGGVAYTAPAILSGQHINIVNLRPGMYFVKINTGKETITRKFIKR